MMFDMSRLHL